MGDAYDVQVGDGYWQRCRTLNDVPGKHTHRHLERIRLRGEYVLWELLFYLLILLQQQSRHLESVPSIHTTQKEQVRRLRHLVTPEADSRPGGGHAPDIITVCLAFAESRIRAETVAAEDVLHDSGAISMISSDSQAMGRVGEVVSRTWRTASKMRSFRGPLTALGDTEGRDNARVKRYIAKYTVNP